MKVALVHELLTMRGGAEKVLRILAEMFPDAPIYTLLYDEAKLGGWFPRNRVRTSVLQPWIRFTTNHHFFLRHFPAAVEAWDFSDFDLVISTSSAFAHGIITNGKPKHLCYVHSPARYLWDRTHDVLGQAGNGLLGPWKRSYLSRTFHKLRIWDSEAADRPDMLLAASKEVQRRIELYWRRESEVVYPPIDDVWFASRPTNGASPGSPLRGETEKYFLIVSTLVGYKRIDLAIDACNHLKLPLKIAGEGPARAALESRAGPTVKFLGYQSIESLRKLYAGAEATIFPGDEDFGLVPVESMACGTPVIAWRGGGALETVLEGKTGAFFGEAAAASLATVLGTLDPSSFDPESCRTQAERFSRASFAAGIRDGVARVMA
ncbi:MAG: glycosyl transferase group 1 [Candidatus Peregrinibacteria bacterium Greene0416_19]|nr:MAG: glycosyl transferase group 1 [Candidatus Peregrinibacteria bacterium Greene0416_19]